MVVFLQARVQGDWDVEVSVRMICSVVVESQKGWNGLRSDRAPTFRPGLLVVELPEQSADTTSFKVTYRRRRLSIHIPAQRVTRVRARTWRELHISGFQVDGPHTPRLLGPDRIMPLEDPLKINLGSLRFLTPGSSSESLLLHSTRLKSQAEIVPVWDVNFPYLLRTMTLNICGRYSVSYVVESYVKYHLSSQLCKV